MMNNISALKAESAAEADFWTARPILERGLTFTLFACL